MSWVLKACSVRGNILQRTWQYLAPGVANSCSGRCKTLSLGQLLFFSNDKYTKKISKMQAFSCFLLRNNQKC